MASPISGIPPSPRACLGARRTPCTLTAHTLICRHAESTAYNFTDTFTIGKFVSFLDSLTADETTVDTSDLEILGTRTRAEDDEQWFFPGCSRPMLSKAIVLATLLTVHLGKAELDAWVIAVKADATHINALGDAWKPPQGDVWHASKGFILLALKDALGVRRATDGKLETAAAVVSSWQPDGAAPV
mgnify:CR=1 FL=1